MGKLVRERHCPEEWIVGLKKGPGPGQRQAWSPRLLPLTTCTLGLRYSGNSPSSACTRQLNPASCYRENALIEAQERSFCLLLQPAPQASICKLISVRTRRQGPGIRPFAQEDPRGQQGLHAKQGVG